ncbi:UNVERIFIED_ORG: Rod binding domain-containing protein [Pseudomonas reinekei]|nr:Rod binding domain-containing protein [Pseudomonas reinekei]
MDMRKSGLVSSSDSGSYSDLNRLNQLKVGDKNSDGNLRKVAQEFESLFLGEMLKSMRSATEALGQDNPMNTPAAKQYQEMYDQQLAVSMSREGGGIGLADVLMRQMSKNKPLAPGESRRSVAGEARGREGSRANAGGGWHGGNQRTAVAGQWAASVVGFALRPCAARGG